MRPQHPASGSTGAAARLKTDPANPGSVRPLLAVPLLVLVALSGCSGGGSPDPLEGAGEEAPELEVTDTTGGIRGIVVDQSIVPVTGAKVVLSGGRNTTTDEEGLFRFLETRYAHVLTGIADKKIMDDELKATLEAGLTEYTQQFVASTTQAAAVA